MKNVSKSLVATAVLLATSLVCSTAMAAAGTTKRAPAAAATAPASAPAQSSAAVMASVPIVLTPGQMDAARRVHTGASNCEFGNKVDITEVSGKPGHFHLVHEKKTYLMLPEETTTGAVRLEDKASGIIWIQIPAKSMMMNSKIGQRVLDGCMSSIQSAAQNAKTDALKSVGVEVKVVK